MTLEMYKDALGGLPILLAKPQLAINESSSVDAFDFWVLVRSRHVLHW